MKTGVLKHLHPYQQHYPHDGVYARRNYKYLHPYDPKLFERVYQILFLLLKPESNKLREGNKALFKIDRKSIVVNLKTKRQKTLKSRNPYSINLEYKIPQIKRETASSVAQGHSTKFWHLCDYRDLPRCSCQDF
jgi:hypothetical protein